MPANEQTRKQRIEHALDALPAEAETLRVPWRGKSERMTVIRIGLDSTVLNPRSHRIKSQLESDLSAKAAIAQDAEGEQAQEAIRKLLRATPGFEALKNDLEQKDQREPGIITRQGRLINANTRAVALADLGREYIEVAVLPADATIGEIYDLELDLQVAQDYRQDYTFTNQLLFIEDLIIEQGRDEQEVAIRLGWATPTKQSSIKKGVDRVRRYVRHLDLIRDIQDMSGGKVPLTDFDDAEQALQEFDTAYESLRDKNPTQARRLKQARTLGLLVDLGYERQRQVDGAWVETHLADAFQEQPVLKDLVGALVASADTDADGNSDGGDLEDFEDPESEDDDADPNGALSAHKVVDVLARRLSESALEETVKLPTAEGEKEFPREIIRAAINDAMRTAAEDAKNAAKAGSALNLPVHLVEEAAKRLAKAREAYDRVSGQDGFDDQGMQKQLDKATRALEALQITVEG